jgi:hypothetical protein
MALLVQQHLLELAPSYAIYGGLGTQFLKLMVHRIHLSTLLI